MLTHIFAGLLVVGSIVLPLDSARIITDPVEEGCDCTATGANPASTTCAHFQLTIDIDEAGDPGICDLLTAPDCETVTPCVIVGTITVTTPKGAILSGGVNYGATEEFDYDIDTCGGRYDLTFTIATGIATHCTKFFLRWCNHCTLP